MRSFNYTRTGYLMASFAERYTRHKKNLHPQYGKANGTAYPVPLVFR